MGGGGSGWGGAGLGCWAVVGQGETSPRPDGLRLLYPGPQILGDIAISGSGGKVMHCSGRLISPWAGSCDGAEEEPEAAVPALETCLSDVRHPPNPFDVVHCVAAGGLLWGGLPFSTRFRF
jgi:hypothetical protein